MLPDVKFPTIWNRFMDEFVPAWVKRQYSPREAWKERPFTRDDSIFFGKGVLELSELFTAERAARNPAYFRHERFRSAYLLYFLPLQAAKFIALFRQYRAVLAGLPRDELHVADLGAGPGTASIALLLTLLDNKDSLPQKIIFHWWDAQEPILRDGKKLVDDYSAEHPLLKGRVEVRLNVAAWENAAERSTQKFDLVLLGNVLNEGRSPSEETRKARGRFQEAQELDVEEGADPATPIDTRYALFEKLLARTGAGGILVIEPAFQGSSQALSRIRNGLAENHDDKNGAWWGPCLHNGACPLARGRDWCHFSIPVEIPGRWFKSFSVRLGGERTWLKYSYLWIKPLASHKTGARELPPPPAETRLVLTDSLRKRGSDLATILLCEPKIARRVTIPGGFRVGRGDWVHLQAGQVRPFAGFASEKKPAIITPRGAPLIAPRSSTASPSKPAVPRSAGLAKPSALPRIHFADKKRRR